MYIPNFPIPEKRITEFEKLGYGMFIHYGLYSQLGRGEWIYWMTDRNMAEYQKLKDSFSAKDFDAEKIVLQAKQRGFKYINLTTRHHEGFSLYDTRGLSDFDSVHAPNCRRDLVAEFCDACHRHGIVPFLYHTTIDWHHPDFESDFDAYLEYLRQSVELLCRHYGKLGGFFFDGNWLKPKADWKLDELYGTIRKYQPDAIIINNTGLYDRGRSIHPHIDCVTYEQAKAGEPLDRDGAKKYLAAESCITLNTHWGYAKNDFNYKSIAQVIEILASSRATGTNLLLNVSPDGDGNIPPQQLGILDAVKDWIDINSEFVYDSEPVYYPHIPYSCSSIRIVKSRDARTLYFVVFDIGKVGDRNVTVDGKYAGVVGFSNFNFDIEKIQWTDNGEELKFSKSNSDLIVDFTGQPYGNDLCVRIAKVTLK